MDLIVVRCCYVPFYFIVVRIYLNLVQRYMHLDSQNDGPTLSNKELVIKGRFFVVLILFDLESY